MPRVAAIALLTACIGSAVAADIYRCKQANGLNTFSQRPCGPNAVMETLDNHTVNPPHSQPTPSPIEQLESYRREVKRIDRITGGKSSPAKRSKADPCDRVTSLQLRNARVAKELIACHSMDDVEHIYGAPSSVSTWSDRKAYDTRWLYREQSDGRLYIYFRDGRVTRWNRHRR